MAHPLVSPSAIRMENLSKDPLLPPAVTCQFAHTDDKAETRAMRRGTWKGSWCPKTFKIAQDTFVLGKHIVPTLSVILREGPLLSVEWVLPLCSLTLSSSPMSISVLCWKLAVMGDGFHGNTISVKGKLSVSWAVSSLWLLIISTFHQLNSLDREQGSKTRKKLQLKKNKSCGFLFSFFVWAVTFSVTGFSAWALMMVRISKNVNTQRAPALSEGERVGGRAVWTCNWGQRPILCYLLLEAADWQVKRSL